MSILRNRMFLSYTFYKKKMLSITVCRAIILRYVSCEYEPCIFQPKGGNILGEFWNTVLGRISVSKVRDSRSNKRFK